MSQIHPSPNEVVRIAASEEIPRRVSIPSGAKAKVFFGASVTDADKEVELSGDNLSVDIAQPVLILTDANTVVFEGLQPIKPMDGVAEENFEGDPKVVKPKEASKKDQQAVAEANENQSIPSLSGDPTPPPNEGGAARPASQQGKVLASSSSKKSSSSSKK